VINIPEESNISKHLGDAMTKTLVMLVLLLVVMQKVCDSYAYTDDVLIHKQALF
jgi:hypothetical protein